MVGPTKKVIDAAVCTSMYERKLLMIIACESVTACCESCSSCACERKMASEQFFYFLVQCLSTSSLWNDRLFRLQFQSYNFRELNASLTISKKSTDYSNMAPNSYQASISSQPSKPYDPLPGSHQKYQHDCHIDATCHQAAVPQNLAGKPYQPIPSRR